MYQEMRKLNRIFYPAENMWELTRFATNGNYTASGVGGKLFKHFLKTKTPLQVKSFADRRWTLDKGNNFYTKLGFTNYLYI